jgi:hypothetical protein
MKLVTIGAKVVSHDAMSPSMAEATLPRQMFQKISRLIAELRPQLPPACGATVKFAAVNFQALYRRLVA